jgi:Flp pilus assembly protein TadD
MNRPVPSKRASLALCALSLLLAAATLTGCAANVELSDEEQLRRALRARGLDPDRIIVPFEISDEMRQWVRESVPLSPDPADRLRRLRDALFDKEMQLEYTWGYTGTAIEVFEQRRANCLAFTNLFVGMAREVGVDVFFLGVERVATYRKHGDLVVVSDHVAVGHGDASVDTDLLIFDFSPYRDQGYRDVHRLSDMTALAMFYSNRGAEALQEDRVPDAVSWLETAVAIDPGLTPAWVNLGVVLRRGGDLPGAEDAYKHALEIDPRTLSAYQNLAALLHIQGRDQEAAGFIRILQKTPSRNPYSYLSLGDLSFNSGRLDEARRFYRRAVNLSGEDAEIFAALGQLAAATGDLRTARKMLRKAQEIDGENSRTRRLAAMVERPRARH